MHLLHVTAYAVTVGRENARQAHSDIFGFSPAGLPQGTESGCGALNGTGYRPEPCSVGCPARGRLLLEGKLALPGVVHAIPDGDLWRLAGLAGPVQRELFGFNWLDDLVALRSLEAVGRARKWVFDWISGEAASQNSAWQPDIAGRRVIRLRHNEYILLAMAGDERLSPYLESVGRHARYLKNHAADAAAGLPRVEALAGRFYAELAGGENASAAADALRRLAEEADQASGSAAGVRSRNPQELHDITELLQWCASLASAAGIAVQDKLLDTVRNAAEILRSLRHADGSLARFHGGGSPPPGRLDRVLAGAGVPRGPVSGLAMGFARMSAGGTTLIADAAAPQSGKQSHSAYASTLAFELVAGRSPVVVSGGPGALFGAAARKSARQTASHSTIEVDGASSSRMSSPVFQRSDLAEIIVVYPDEARAEQLPGDDGNTLIISHNGYTPLFGLTHMRRLDMSPDGVHVQAEDTLWAQPGEDRRVFESVASAREGGMLPFAARFHLHPDTRVAPEPRHRHVGLELPDGSAWGFEFEGAAELKIEPGVYFDENARQARDSCQIVLRSGIAQDSAARLRWELKRGDAKL